MKPSAAMDDEAPVGSIQIGAASLDPSTQRLLREGRDVRLDPKEVGVLLELAAAAPAVVTREHLLARVWAGASVVPNAVEQVIARLRRVLGDSARQPTYIETLPKRGYRLMVPVMRAFPADADESAESRLATVTLLPLATIGADPSLVEYARIASEDISNRLSEGRSVRVIAHGPNGSGQRAPKFLAQGTLRRVADRIRVSVQLLRTHGGDMLWSESFEEPLSSATRGPFAHAPFVARTIESIVRSAHAADRLPTASEPARRHFFHGLREADAVPHERGDWVVAANHFERALDHDPNLKGALEQLAYAYGNRLGERIHAEQALAGAHRALPRLLRIDPNATLSLAWVNHSLDLDYASALANIEHAQRHGFANLAFVEFHKALVRYKQGWFDEAAERMQAAIRAGLGSNESIGHYMLADLLWAMGRFSEALASVDRGLACAVPNWHRGQMLRIRLGAFMGRIDEAKRDLERTWAVFGESHRASFPGVLASLGQPELARTILQENDAAWRAGRLFTASYSQGAHHTLGEFDQSFVWLDRAIGNREWWMLPFLRSKVHYENIRDDPRFRQAMRRLEEIEATPSPTQSVATAGAGSK